MDRPPETSSRAPEAGASPAPARAASGIEVAVVVPSAGTGAVYVMYEAHGLSPEGVTLSGGLLLEKHEEVTIELRLPDRGSVRVRARVAAIERAALRVAFIGLDDPDRQRLSRYFAPPPPP